MKRIPSLDGFRAISISLVVASHLWSAAQASHHNALSFWGRFLDGDRGVFIFFVISGYLISSLLLQEFDRTGSVALGRFYFRRLFRIAPPLYAYIAFILLTASLSGLYPAPPDVLTALTFTRNLDLHPHGFVFEHFWSLCIEEQFYLIWPFLFLILLKKGGRSPAIKLALGLIVAAPLLRIATYPLIHSQPMRQFVNGLLPSHMDALMFGCWAALAQGSRAFESLYTAIARRPWLLPLWFFVLSEFLYLRFGNFYRLSLGDSLDGLIVVCMIFWAVRNSHGVVGRALNSRPVAHLGVISYSIYIWQTYFLHVDNHTRFARFPLNLLCILVAAEASFYGVERLSLHLRDRIQAGLLPKRSPVLSTNR